MQRSIEAEYKINQTLWKDLIAIIAGPQTELEIDFLTSATIKEKAVEKCNLIGSSEWRSIEKYEHD